MLAEQMLDIHAQVLVIDPVGNWWGLRVGANGRSKGKDIFVIGGEHGDVPVVPEAGRRIAQLVVEKGISAVVDVSGFRIGEHKRFAADFAEEFFHLKKTKKSPVHIFIEEAQTLIPQRVGPDEARMVGAFERIVRLGRNYGIGCTLVTQRPQSVNKEVLSQVECLCVLQITGPHERKAIEEWVSEKGADRKLVGELPSLERGEGYVWSPSWLRTYQRVHFAKKQTFDASATPEVGKATKAASISAVNVEALKSDMAEVVAQAEKDDPKALRAQISNLARELRTAQSGVKVANPTVRIEEKRIEVPVLKDTQIARLETVFTKMTKEADRHGEAMALLWGNFDEMGKSMLGALSAIRAFQSKPPTAGVSPTRPEDTTSPERPRYKAQAPTPRTALPAEGGITNPEQRVLNGVAWMENIGVREPAKEIVAFLSGYAHIMSKGFTNPCGSLRAKGLITYPAPGKIALTDEGRAAAQFPDRLGTTEGASPHRARSARHAEAARIAATTGGVPRRHVG